MSRYLTPKYLVGVAVFIITGVGSIWLFSEEEILCRSNFSPSSPIYVSAKFAHVRHTPTRMNPQTELQFINETTGWISQEKNLWQTQNGGNSWQRVYEIQHDLSGEFNDIHFTNANDGWATILYHLYKTADGGRNWTRVATPMDEGYGSIRAFHLDGKTGWIAGGVYQPLKIGESCVNNATRVVPEGASVCLKGAVFRTDDGGLSWHPQNNPQHVGRFMSITFTDQAHAWVAGDAGVFHTTDGGQTWSHGKFRRDCENYFELPDRYPASTAFVDNQNGWLTFSSGQIAKTNDGGKTWCDFFEPETLWPEDDASAAPGRFRSIHFRAANYGIGLSHDGLVYETFDGGATWHLEGTELKFDAIVFFDKANGWAISKHHDLYRVRLDDPAAQDLVAPREEPRQLIDELSSAESISFQGYVVKRLNRKVRSEGEAELEVSYAGLFKNNRQLLKFDGVYFDRGNATDLGLFDLLGPDSEQLIVSQTVPRGGRHWVVGVSPRVRVLFDSWDYDVGREEFYVIDIDKDGVYEIVLPVTAFYGMQDKMYIGEIPLPEIVFKYDAKARKYLPANHRFADWALYGIQSDIEKLGGDDDNNYLSKRLRILLRYVYARKQREGWAFFAQAYQRADRKEIEARIRSVLKDDPLYNYLY